MRLRPGILLALCLTTMVCMSSCVHEYICQCEVKYNGMPGLPDSTVREYEVTDTKKNAKKVCEESSTSHDKDGIHTDENCHLY